MTSRTVLLTARSFCLVAILIHVAAFFLPVYSPGKFDRSFQQVQQFLPAAPPPLIGFDPESVSYLWSRMLLVNAVFVLAITSMALGRWKWARNASVIAVLLALGHAALLACVPFGGGKLLVGYYVWVASIATLACAAIFAEVVSRPNNSKQEAGNT